MIKVRSLLLSSCKNVIHNYYRNCSTSEITAGVLIIGDEILNGQTPDTNSEFFIKNLNVIGLKINKICVLPDNIDVISQEVISMSENCTVVLTSGGIGPTHDDVTFAAVAKAFDENLTLNKELVSLFRDYFGPDAAENPAVLKFASIPQSAVLNFGVDSMKNKFPLISTKNIYMFPGVPLLLKKGFEVFKNIFILHNQPNHVKSIFLATDEFELTPLLNEAVKIFENKVKFGSYPAFYQNYYKVKLVLESKDETWLKKADNYFNENLPVGSIVTLKDEIFSSPYQEVNSLAQDHNVYKEAISVVEEALEKFSLSKIALCFSGGKDCTSLLHLVYSCVQNKVPEQWHLMNSLFINSGDNFTEIEDFIKLCEINYQLKLVTISGDLKSSLETFMLNHPHVKAVFMGSRRGDPSTGEISHFHPTDKGWPHVTRICPLLNWTYKDVWFFIRTLQLPYCTLYDSGYTSLGSKSQTKRNPALLVENQKSICIYKPAYLLESDRNERSGRT